MRQPLIAFLALALAGGCAHGSNGSRTSTARATTASNHVSSTQTAHHHDEGDRMEVASTADRACGEAQVFFASGSTELNDDARGRLNSYAECLQRHEIDVVYVAGRTDPAGSAEDNLALGRTRARAVADFLRENGVDVEFVIRSYGEAGAAEGEQLWPLERSVTAGGSPD